MINLSLEIKAAKMMVVCSAIIMSACSRQEMAVYIENTLDTVRINEIVELNAERVTNRFNSNFIIKDDRHNEVPYQLTHDGLLIFPVTVSANMTTKYHITKGEPSAIDTIAVATYRADCQDDVAWENDHGGYRLYGPIFRKGGGKVYGYDIWTKSVSYPVLNRRYDDDHKRGISYHIDHGDGFDGYIVGPTLGCGMNALVNDNGEICYPCAYQSYKLLDNGPLRTTIRFVIDTINVNSQPVVETRTITLDAGAWLNRTVTSYSGLNSSSPIVAGIAVHCDNPEYTLNNDSHYISYADKTDNITAGNGEIFIGVLASEADSLTYRQFPEVVVNAMGQALLLNTYHPSDKYTYYWGSAWSKGGVPTIKDWNNILEKEAHKLKQPLKTTIK
jgi:hypothetical protein